MSNYLEVDGYKYMRCSECSLVQLQPLPNSEITENYYDQEYYEVEGYVTSNPKQHEKNMVELRNKLKTVARRIGTLTKKKILDFGTAVGYFLDIAKEANLETYGYELSRFGQGQIVEKGHTLVTDFSAYKSFFDIITLWNVAEHFLDPLEEFTKLYDMLKAGGRIFIATSCIDDFVDKHIFGYSVWAYPPQHIFLYNKSTLKEILTRCGFVDIKIEYSHKSGNHFWNPVYILKLGVMKHLFYSKWKESKTTQEADEGSYLFVSAAKQ